MDIKLKFVSMLLPVLFSCASVDYSTRMTKRVKSTNGQHHINLQFSTGDACSFKLEDCEGVWNQNKQLVYLSGLLVYQDSLGTAEEINISIEGLDLKNAHFPYAVGDNICESAFVSWYDEEEVLREKFLCSGSNHSCEYQGNVRQDKIKLVLTGFENNVLEGKFTGRIFLKGTGKLQFVKTSEYKDITEGSFKVSLIKTSGNSNMSFVASSE